MLAEEAVARHAGFEQGRAPSATTCTACCGRSSWPTCCTTPSAGPGSGATTCPGPRWRPASRRCAGSSPRRCGPPGRRAPPGADPAVPVSPFDVELARATATQLAEVRAAVRPLARRLAARLRRRRQSIRSGVVDMKRTRAGGRWPPAACRSTWPSAALTPTSPSCSRCATCPARWPTSPASPSRSSPPWPTSWPAPAPCVRGRRRRDHRGGRGQPGRRRAVADPPGRAGHRRRRALGLRDRAPRLPRPLRAGLTDRSTLVITGDARNNYRPPGGDVLADIARRVRAVYWLNPEPAASGTPPTRWSRLRPPTAAGVFEVRTLRQLGDAWNASCDV